MLKVIGRRLALAIPLLIVISTFAFFLVSMIPGDPVVALLGPDATAEDYAAVRAELGLDRPMLIQYFDWMFGVLQGDMGNSIRTGRPVAATIWGRLPVTTSLAVIAIIATALIGTALGLVSSLRGGVIGKVAQVGSVIGTSLPNFWLGILLVLFFAVSLKWLPATGYVPFERSPSDWAESLVLPVVAITVAAVAAIARQTRSAMNDVLGRDFIRTLLATGTSRNRVIYRHALRNAAIPVVTSLSFQFINLLSGAVVIETVFTLPGLGELLVVAISARDIPVVQGVVIVTAILVILVNLVVDLVNAWLNPKVRT